MTYRKSGKWALKTDKCNSITQLHALLDLGQCNSALVHDLSVN